jgi:general secretion pathway protein C
MSMIAIRSLDENRYELPRSELERALARLDELAAQARMLPAYRDGQPQGFKVFAIRPDSFFSKLGLVNGDVVRRINGFEMNTPANALEVYQRLRDTSQIEVELERNGSSIRKSYAIR